jgi:hypothetical protein
MAYQDDIAIGNDVRLFRRIHPQWIVRDDNLNCFRPSSQAFNNSQDDSPMSVNREDILQQENREPAVLLTGFHEWGLASVRAGVMRENGQGIAADPLPDEQSHALVFGPKPPKTRKRIAKTAEWVIQPSDRPAAR